MLEFEISDYVSGKVATIKLSDVDIDPIVDNVVQLVNVKCVENIVIDLNDLRHDVIKSLRLVSNYTCIVKIISDKHPLTIASFSCYKINIASSGGLTINNMHIDGARIDCDLPYVTGSISVTAQSNKEILALRDLIRGVNILPGSGEYVYDVKIQGDTNHQNGSGLSNSVYNINQIKKDCPALQWASPVVTWYCDSKDAGECRILPGVEGVNEKAGCDPWHVSDYVRSSAYKISKDHEGRPNYGGSVNDESMLSYLKCLRGNGYSVMLYPMIFVDMPGKPWRGYITGTADGVRKFFNGEYGYNKFILHYANLACKDIDAIVIGSEFRDLTKVQDASGNFVAVEELINLARLVKQVVGNHVKVTYAADWSEYHHYGAYYTLDSLWACEWIDVVGIDAYFPITNKSKGDITAEDIKRGWKSGEGYDYWVDYWNKNAHNKLDADWAWKNVEHWWNSVHFDYPNNNWDASNKRMTAWRPKMKPIWFTEFGFSSMHYAPNKPNVFFDTLCVDGGVPTNSSGVIDFEVQLVALRASLELWKDSECVQNMFIWAWDARPYPFYPESGYWSDGRLWAKGHWISGKLNEHEPVIRGKIVAERFKLKVEQFSEVHLSFDKIKSLFVDIDIQSDVALNLNEINSKMVILKSGGRAQLNVSGRIGTFIVENSVLVSSVSGSNVLDNAYMNVLCDKFYYKGSNLHLSAGSKILSSDELILDIENELEFLYYINSNVYESDGGSDTLRKVDNQACIVRLEAPVMLVNAHDMVLHGSNLKAKLLAIRGTNLSLRSLV